ncbi:hypothetical protein TNCV_3537191, partial [Trichonephila clavipes]
VNVSLEKDEHRAPRQHPYAWINRQLFFFTDEFQLGQINDLCRNFIWREPGSRFRPPMSEKLTITIAKAEWSGQALCRRAADTSMSLKMAL